MARILLKNITKRWGDFVAVDRQSLDIKDREFLVLLGPSGCGKTTTMRMIAGLEEPTAGEVWIGDRMVNDDLPKDRDVAMVFQNYGLYPHMSVFNNIAYPLKIRKSVPRSRIPELVNEAAERVELVPFLHRRPRELSGGQRQRVALARAIVREPQAFLMDEPLSNLDAKLRVTMRAELKHLSHELQITTVYVTHDQIEAMTLADRIGVMNEGKIRQLGTPDEIYNDPANIFVADFIGSPSMNLISGRVEGHQFVTVDRHELTRTAMGAMSQAVLGVRAEDIHVVAAGSGDVDGQVYAAENTGENVVLTLQLGGQRITCKEDRYIRFSIGETVGLKFDSNKNYLFDPSTGDRVRSPGN